MSSLTFLLCGCLSQEDGHHQDTWWPATPRRSRSGSGGSNPYSTRGLDKFAAVLAELEAKKKKIVAQLGSQHGEAWVRFAQSNSNDWVPIVVKVKRPEDKKKAKLALPQTVPASCGKPPEKKLVGAGRGRKEVKIKSLLWNTKQGGGGWLWLRWRPGYYWPVVFVLILVCVVLFGRPFAIVCTSIWWYMVPSLKGNGANMRKSTKEYVKKISGNKLGGDHLIIRSTAQPRKLGTS